MNYAILSAGEGSRLQQDGILVPKPLVKLNGIPMIERLIDVFMQNDAQSVSIIANNLHSETQQFLRILRQKLNIPLNIVCKTTPSSLHSFYELTPYLQNDKFCLTTVDTLFDPAEFTKFIQTFKNALNLDGLMAVTSHIDDESPLYVKTEKDLNICGFLDKNDSQCKYISGGIYCLSPVALKTLEKAYNNKMSRMRNLQREFLRDGLRLKAYPFSKILDIDHAEDVTKAQQFLDDLLKKNPFDPKTEESDQSNWF